MAANVLLDVSLGSIPFVGDAFDAFFKANTRNVKLLDEARERHRLGEPMPAAPSVRYLVGVGLVLLLAVGLVFAAASPWPPGSSSDLAGLIRLQARQRGPSL